MNPNKLFPLVITDKMAQTKAFYLEQAGFQIVHDMDDYLQVRWGFQSGCGSRLPGSSPLHPAGRPAAQPGRP